MSQCDQILNYMKEYGSITSLDAIHNFGCTRLSGRIYDLKKRGYSIDCSNETVTTRNGNKTNIVRYSLSEDAE